MSHEHAEGGQRHGHEWAEGLPGPCGPEAWAPLPIGDPTIPAHDDKGYSEERCVRCGWVMGRPPLNCNNDNTPHVFPSQFRAVQPERSLDDDLLRPPGRCDELDVGVRRQPSEPDDVGRWTIWTPGLPLLDLTDTQMAHVARAFHEWTAQSIDEKPF